MKYFLHILILSLFISCDNNQAYELEEDKAIEDITNDFIKYYIQRGNSLPGNDKFDDNVIQRDLNQNKIKVYISDALIPISQVYEDNKWMTSRNYQVQEYEEKLKELYNSSIFENLTYREINKQEIKLDELMRQCYDCQDKMTADEQYSMISFSRICFDKEMLSGLVVIHYGVGYESSSMSGYHGPFLIRKENDSWKIIYKN